MTANYSTDHDPVSVNEIHYKKVYMSDYGHEMAGLNRGDEVALENCLNAIKEGHVVDINFSEVEHNRRKAEIEGAILVKEQEIIDAKGKASKISNILIPAKEETLKDKETELKNVERDKIEGKLISEYCRTRHLVFSILTCILALYLVMFYASAIYSSFFRNLLQDISTGGTTDNIHILLNSIFDPAALFTLQPSTLFMYFGSCLFFAIGLLAHQQVHKQKKTSLKILVGILSYGFPLIVDSLVAYKIHQNIEDAKKLMGMTEETYWYSSVNFWLVIAFGYLAYIVWALLFEETLREAARKNTDRVANYLISGIKKEIASLKLEIKNLRLELNDLNTLSDRLRQEQQNLKGQLGKVLQDPNLLLRNLHNFFDGWLRYINGSESMESLRKSCESVFNQFKEKHFTYLNKAESLSLTFN